MLNGGRRSRRLTARVAVSTATVMALLLGGAFAGTAQAAPSSVKKTFTSNTTVPIPDFEAGAGGADPGHAASTVSVSGLLGNITDVRVSVYLTHGAISDLDAALVGPDGTSFALFFGFNALPSDGTSLGTSCADGDRTVFADGAGSSIEKGTSPFAGTYRPQDSLVAPLSVFTGNGFTFDGDWAFDVLDWVGGNTGTIECWSLFIDTDQGQSLRFDNDTPVSIPDGSGLPASGPGTSTINATGLGTSVTAVTASVWITHEQDSDLDVYLISPSGKEIKLAARVGGTGNDFGKSCSKPTVFDDTAKTAIGGGTAPFVGTFKPSEALAGFRGTTANGKWRLQVWDRVANKVGQINCWSLTVSSSSTTESAIVLTPDLAIPQPLPGTYDYATFTIANNTPNAMTNVTLTGLLPALLTSDVREVPSLFPESCDVNNAQFTCTWASIAAGASVVGGVIAKVGNPTKKSGTKLCLEGSIAGTGFSPIKASKCFTVGAYGAGDTGTGFAIGDKAHDLVLPNQNGVLTALSQYKGKYVLLNFTAVWCGPSNFEVPRDRDEIAALNQANAMGVPIVHVSVLIDGPQSGESSTKANAVNWRNKYDLTGPVLWTANDAIWSARQQHLAYDAAAGQFEPGFPTTVFIRPDGTIFDVRIGAEDDGGTTERFLADLP